MIEPIACSYDDFPPSPLSTTGMKTLKADPVKLCSCLGPIVYANRDGYPLSLQILIPFEELTTPGTALLPFKLPETPRPCIIYIQGSAWLEQQILSGIPQLSDFARRGYVIAIVQYRPSTIAPFPAQILDTKAAIRFMKRHAADYGVDPEQFVLWGDSSGGHTAVMAGITGDSLLPCDDSRDILAAVRCIVDYYGPTDISKMCEEASTMDHIGADCPEGLFIGGLNVLENPEKVSPTVPMTYITEDRDIPPLLIFHGNKDRLVPFGQSVALYEKLRDCGKKAEFYKLDLADHGSGEFWSTAVYDLVESFIKENIK